MNIWKSFETEMLNEGYVPIFPVLTDINWDK